MQLVYKATRIPVKVGDPATIHSRDVTVEYFRKPHSPASEGKLTVKDVEGQQHSAEYYVSIIGAEWIDREDRIEPEIRKVDSFGNFVD